MICRIFIPTGDYGYLPGLYRTDDYDLLAMDIQEKSAKEVKKYYLIFKKKWKQLAGKSFTSRVPCQADVARSVRESQNQTAQQTSAEAGRSSSVTRDRDGHNRWK
jgi:hypothetical protein